MHTRTIEIDLEIHRLIEAARTNFEETPNDILRQLLKLPGAKQSSVKAASASTLGKSSVAWFGKGISLPHGTLIKMTYGGRQYEGRIENGMWVVEGSRHRSPSAAACAVAVTRQGKKTNLNGWRLWYVKRPGDPEWILLEILFLRRRGDLASLSLQDLGLA